MKMLNILVESIVRDVSFSVCQRDWVKLQNLPQLLLVRLLQLQPSCFSQLLTNVIFYFA